MTTIRINSAQAPVTTLGPAPAVGLWVQGCHIGCAGCMSPHTWNPRGGAVAHIDTVAGWMAATGLKNLTISGGEPMEQAQPLADLVDRLRSRSEWAVTCYSGHRREDLESDGPEGSRALLDRIDLLIDGPYRPSEHASLLWRGSQNQRLHVLTDRVTLPTDEPAGLGLSFDADGAFVFVGVPAEPDFLKRFEANLGGANGSPYIHRPATFPFPVLEEN